MADSSFTRIVINTFLSIDPPEYPTKRLSYVKFFIKIATRTSVWQPADTFRHLMGDG